MIKNIFKFFSKKEPLKNSEEIYNKNDIFNILISLNDKFEIDLVVYMKDTPHYSLTELEHSVVCSEFLNSSFSIEIKDQILDIIKKQIKNDKNSSLIDNICLADKINQSVSSINDNVFIRPSQVFTQYST